MQADCLLQISLEFAALRWRLVCCGSDRTMAVVAVTRWLRLQYFLSTWLPCLLDCELRLMFFFKILCSLQPRAACTSVSLPLSKGLDDAQSFLCYVLSTKFSFRILFSITCTLRHRRDYDESSCRRVSMITEVANYARNVLVRESISEA